MIVMYHIKSNTNYTQMTDNYSASLIPASEQIYYGWYCEAVQQLRVSYPSRHKFEGKILTSPPYCYWKQTDKLVLVTEVTNTAFPTPRQVKNGDIFLGPLDSYHGRSYRRLSDKEIQAPTPTPSPTPAPPPAPTPTI
jgi:hypothetical protein